MSELVDDLHEEAGLCRNDGANDIALLLDRAAQKITELEANEVGYERIIGRKTYQEVADEIAQLKAQLEWQPIESAPKNGTNVLLVNVRGNMATGLWQGLGKKEGWWLRGGDCPNTFFNHHHGPTHWMTLPQPPENKGVL